jgi:hypothetical protein
LFHAEQSVIEERCVAIVKLEFLQGLLVGRQEPALGKCIEAIQHSEQKEQNGLTPTFPWDLGQLVR